jgi:hypothetical protein
MRELRWNELDVVECLGVMGRLDEDSAVYEYRVEIDDLILDLAICAYHSHVSVNLSNTKKNLSIFEAEFFIAEELEYINEGRIGYLEFSDCIFAGYTDDIDLDS